MWITLTRGLGQSALSVISITTVGQWFVTRTESAMAIYSVVLSVGFMIAFPIVGWAVQRSGWRAAWFAVGVALLAGLAPLSWLGVRRGSDRGQTGVKPGSDRGQTRDTAGSEQGQTEVRHGFDPGLTPDVTLGGAMRTPGFWVFAVGTALYGLIASGIGLFNESILAERGFGPVTYYQTLGVTPMTGLAGNFLGGWLASRVALGRLLATSMFLLAVGLVVLPHVSTPVQVMAWASAMWIGGGIVMVLFFSVWPRVFGRPPAARRHRRRYRVRGASRLCRAHREMIAGRQDSGRNQGTAAERTTARSRREIPSCLPRSSARSFWRWPRGCGAASCSAWARWRCGATRPPESDGG